MIDFRSFKMNVDESAMADAELPHGVSNATPPPPVFQRRTTSGCSSPILGQEVPHNSTGHRNASQVNGGTVPGGSTDGRDTRTVEFVPINYMQNMMQEMMTQLIRTTAQAFNPPNVRPTPRMRSLEHIYVPAFDPDDRTDTVQVWCRNIEELKTEYELTDREILNLTRKNLRGRAAEWARRNYSSLTSWTELKIGLIETFADEARYYDDLTQFMEYTSEQASSLAEYATRKWELAKKAIGVEMTEQRLVEAVISGMSDFRIRSDLLRLTPKSLPQLIQSLNSYKRKRPGKESDHTIPSKRFKNVPSSDIASRRCHKCHKLGHLQKDCRSGSTNRGPQKNSASTSDSSKPAESKPLKNNTCTFCNRRGHTFENCFQRLNKNAKDEKLSHVNSLVLSNKNLHSIKIENRDYSCLIDSGAECSLMRESIGDSIKGRIIYKSLILRGVGDNSFRSSRTKLCMVCIDGLNIELEFVLVPDRYIQYDVLLGQNLFDIRGIQVTFSKDFVKVCRNSYNINCIQKEFDLDMVDVNPDISPEIKIQLHNLLQSYSEMFTSGNAVSQVTTGELTIRLKNPEKIVQRRPYRLAPAERDHVKKLIKDLKDNNIIRDSNSPFASPILLVRKKDGSDRMCVDYRELNSNTVRDHFPLPIIDDHISKLSGAKYFSVLDMAAGFHQIPIAKDSIEKTAFVTPDGQYEFLRMPFGLCNAPSVFQRAINTALKQFVDDFVLIYIDDVVIYSETVDQGIERLKVVLDALQKTGFSLNVKKCKFLQNEIEYLGRIVSNGQVKPSPGKVHALLSAPIPTTVKHVRQFCGLASYFRKFIPNFSLIMIPLYNLTRSNVKWNWTSEHEAARNKILEYLASEPVLTLFDPTKSVELHTDASSAGLGGILFQKHNDQMKVVEYFSMRTTDTESRYHSYELETLAVVRSIKHFRHYLLGRPFKVVTDCNSLKASRNKKELLPRVHRWWAYLQSFDFTIEYRKGERIPHVDYLSRNPTTVNISNVQNYSEWLEVEQNNDPETKTIIESIQQGSIDKNVASSYEIQGGLLYRVISIGNKIKKRLFVPKSYRWHIIQIYHDSLKHFGWEKTLEKIREQFWFPNMSKCTRKYVDNCLTCKINKSQSGSRQITLHPIDKPPTPFHTIHMDTTGKLSGNKPTKQYAVVFIDAFTKFVFIKPVTNLTAAATVNCLKELIYTFGTPKRIVCDQAASYTGREFSSFCEHWSIELHFIASGVSRANGQVERMMKVLTNCFTIVENTSKRSWKDAVGEVQLAINSTFSKSTGRTPFQLLMGCDQSPPAISALLNDVERLDLDACREESKLRMDELAQTQKANYDKTKAKIVPFKVGDTVLIRQNPRAINKLDSKFRGPCVITEIHDNDRYTVRVHKTGNELYVSHDNMRIVSPDMGCELTDSLDTSD